MKKILVPSIILLLLSFATIWLAVTNYKGVSTGELENSCVLGIKDYTFRNSNKLSYTLYCIEGVQYISINHKGLAPFINPQAIDNYFDNGYRSCGCDLSVTK